MRAFANSRLQIVLFLALAFIVSVATIATAMRVAEKRAQAELRRTAGDTLKLQTETIVSQLDKYRHVPALTARRQDVLALVEGGIDPDETGRARRIVTDAMALSGAIDAAFATPDGDVVASATGYLSGNMIGNNELLAAPRQGRLGRASISGANGRRSYAFSTGIRIGRKLAAIIVIAAPLESIEQTWALSVNPIFALNGAGQLVAGNQIARDREADIRLALVKGADAESFMDDAAGGTSYMAFSRFVPLMDWTLFVLVPRTAILEAKRNAATVALLGAALVTLAGLGVIIRLQEARRRRRHERMNALRLERTVRHRTRELSQSNARLAVEVEERRNAESALRKAQGELIQSAKLAAIGQMSAALAHEYNQPLAAIRSYAENARLLLEKRKNADVTDNLERIGAMVERMATLSKTLKSFARRPRSSLAEAQLDAVLRDSLLLVEHKAKNSGMKIVCNFPPCDAVVLAGPVRLAQVFVNLIANAIDANEQSGGRQISVDWTRRAGMVDITIADEGPGIAEADRASIFDPFFTTKEVGEGLGLGLSIAYNIVQDFGGTLVAENREGGGARFTVSLKSVDKPARAAE